MGVDNAIPASPNRFFVNLSHKFDWVEIAEWFQIEFWSNKYAAASARKDRVEKGGP